MADGRIIHRKASQGDRVRGLSHLAYRVWTQYILSADDYGVMRASVAVIQGDNPTLEQEPVRRIQHAMNTIALAGLVEKFEHQGARYWWQPDWQDWQQIRYPRDTVHPAPSADALATATEATRKLFSLRAVPSRQRLRKVSETVTETSPIPAGAGWRETLTLTPTLTPTLPESGDESAREGGKSTAFRARPLPVLDPMVFEPVSGVPPRWSNGQTRTAEAAVYHARHCPPWGAAACDAGLCIPKYLWPQWEKRQSVEALTAFVGIWATKAAGDKAETFWPAAFERHFGVSVSSAPTGRMTAAQRTIATMRGGKTG